MRALTDAVPLELLPVGERPLLGILLDEIRGAGLAQAILISGPERRPVEEYARRAWPKIHVARQETPGNLVGALQRARSFLADEPFVLAIPTFLIRTVSPAGPMERLMKLYAQHCGHAFTAVRELAAGRCIFSTSIFTALESGDIGPGDLPTILQAAGRTGDTIRSDMLQPGEECVIIETLANYQNAFFEYGRPVNATCRPSEEI
ncbi:MAG TPA: hypothetical protein VFJ58_12700 [Armatimonadota bacterium]|nr:hypothetical protein [Armatimonadota bacterium]